MQLIPTVWILALWEKGKYMNTYDYLINNIVPATNEIIKPPYEGDYNDFRDYSNAVDVYRRQLRRQACIHACALGLVEDVFNDECDEYVNVAF
jgi:hypothetical protein